MVVETVSGGMNNVEQDYKPNSVIDKRNRK